MLHKKFVSTWPGNLRVQDHFLISLHYCSLRLLGVHGHFLCDLMQLTPTGKESIFLPSQYLLHLRHAPSKTSAFLSQISLSLNPAKCSQWMWCSHWYLSKSQHRRSPLYISALLFLVSVFLNGRLNFLFFVVCCFNCRGQGHKAKDCPSAKIRWRTVKRRRRKQQRKGEREERRSRRGDKWCITTSMVI